MVFDNLQGRLRRTGCDSLSFNRDAAAAIVRGRTAPHSNLEQLQIAFAHHHPAQLELANLPTWKTDRTFLSGNSRTLLSGTNTACCCKVDLSQREQSRTVQIQ
jgi:hypothetical protein